MEKISNESFSLTYNSKEGSRGWITITQKVMTRKWFARRQ
jgi:hypothetical protein